MDMEEQEGSRGVGKRGDEVNSPILVGVSLLFRYPRVSKEGLATSSKLSMTLESQIRFTSVWGWAWWRGTLW